MPRIVSYTRITIPSSRTCRPYSSQRNRPVAWSVPTQNKETQKHVNVRAFPKLGILSSLVRILRRAIGPSHSLHLRWSTLTRKRDLSRVDEAETGLQTSRLQDDGDGGNCGNHSGLLLIWPLKSDNLNQFPHLSENVPAEFCGNRPCSLKAVTCGRDETNR
jgi:hypothetical protein